MLFEDALFKELVVQRSRAYITLSQRQLGSTEALFPLKQPPQVVPYSVKKTYGHLLGKLEIAFAKEKPLFALAPYYPLSYFKGDPESVQDFEKGRQRGIVRLIRIGFLKRFESSITAFEQSCQNLLLKLLAFIKVKSETEHELTHFEKWKIRNAELLEHIQARKSEFEEECEEEEDTELADEFAILKRLADIDKTLPTHDSSLRDIYKKLIPLLSPPPATSAPASAPSSAPRMALARSASSSKPSAPTSSTTLPTKASPICLPRPSPTASSPSPAAAPSPAKAPPS